MYDRTYLSRAAQHDQATSGANAAVSITLVAVARRRHLLEDLTWSYDTNPTGGRLTITGLDGDSYDIDITIGGPGPLAFAPKRGALGAPVTVTLAAGGGTAIGKLNLTSVVD